MAKSKEKIKSVKPALYTEICWLKGRATPEIISEQCWDAQKGIGMNYQSSPAAASPQSCLEGRWFRTETLDKLFLCSVTHTAKKAFPSAQIESPVHVRIPSFVKSTPFPAECQCLVAGSSSLIVFKSKDSLCNRCVISSQLITKWALF